MYAVLKDADGAPYVTEVRGKLEDLPGYVEGGDTPLYATLAGPMRDFGIPMTVLDLRPDVPYYDGQQLADNDFKVAGLDPVSFVNEFKIHAFNGEIFHFPIKKKGAPRLSPSMPDIQPETEAYAAPGF